MPLPIQFTRRLTGIPRPGEGNAADAGPFTITAFDPAHDTAAVAALAQACRGAEGPHAGHFLPAGMLAELAGRPGRGVQAWLAWPHAETGWAEHGAVAARPPRRALGLVTLVVVPALPPRASIGWLLVDPAARRRGVGRALAALAVAAAHAAGAERVTAETLPTWPAAAAFWRAAGFSDQPPGADR